MNTTQPAVTGTPPATAPLRYGPPITLAVAKRVMAAAEAEAQAHGWPMVIAIVDSGAHLVMLQRCDHTQLGSVVIAQRKAETALNFKRPTKAFEDTIAGGGIGVRILSMEGVCALEGGILLLHEGAIVGAIGVSGMLSSQDAQVANAGARALLDLA